MNFQRFGVQSCLSAPENVRHSIILELTHLAEDISVSRDVEILWPPDTV